MMESDLTILAKFIPYTNIDHLEFTLRPTDAYISTIWKEALQNNQLFSVTKIIINDRWYMDVPLHKTIAELIADQDIKEQLHKIANKILSHSKQFNSIQIVKPKQNYPQYINLLGSIISSMYKNPHIGYHLELNSQK